MCLSHQARAAYRRRARAMDDARLHELDHHYRVVLGARRSTVDLELHRIVISELESRREERIRRLQRSLWLSTRRGRLVEAIKRWLVRHGIWSSSRCHSVAPWSRSALSQLRGFARRLPMLTPAMRRRPSRIAQH
jgi:hypothetical protein